MGKVNILGVNVYTLGVKEAADAVMRFLDEDAFHSVYTPNSEIIMEAYKDKEFAALLNRASLLTADGIGVVYAARMLKKPISERAAGYDIACEVLSRLTGENKLFLFGGKPGVAQAAAENLTARYKNLCIAGMRNGYFKPEEEAEITDEINKSGADILFVCLGAPAQEKFIDRNRGRLKVRAALGIGGSIDVFAGTAQRAPEFWCKHGLEWLYRLCKEPWRWKRMMALPKFAATVFLKGGSFKQD